MVTAVVKRLRRVTNHHQWIPEIDGLRFVAIASVVLFHLAGELANRSGRIIPLEARYRLLGVVAGNGDRGVRLFFVISGLVLALPFARQFLNGGRAVRLPAYYLRRVTRLEPPYIASVLLFVAANTILVGHMPSGYLRHAVASMFYLHNVVYADISPVNMVSWSLEVEVQFYLLAPLLMQVFRLRSKLLRRSLLVSATVLCGLLQIHTHLSARTVISVLYYVQYFLAGLLLADVFVLELPHWKQSAWWDIAGLAGLAAMFGIHDWVPAQALLPFTMTLLCLGGMRGPVLRRFVSTPWVAITGGMCYSIYLMHFIVIAAMFKLTRRLIVPRFDFLQNLLIQGAVLIPAVMIVSIAFYVLLERPCMNPNWPQKLLGWLKGQPSGSVRRDVERTTHS